MTAEAELSGKPLGISRTPLGISCHGFLWWEVDDVEHDQGWADSPVSMKCSHESFLQAHFCPSQLPPEILVLVLLETLLLWAVCLGA